jgi:hypothetical protein
MPLRLPRLRWQQRVVMACAGAVLIGLLVLASRLMPSPRGLGTHQQLGLPPCTIVAWYGIRCPSCGMTTAWAHLVRGELAAAFRASAGGALLAMAAVVSGPWLVASGVRGRWVVGPPPEAVTLGLGFAVALVMMIEWAVRLALGW